MTDSSSQPPRFDFDDVFDADYLAFYEAELNEMTNDEESDVIAALLDIEEGDRVLDLPCGHGRIALSLAQVGADVVGIDASEVFLERARADADARGLDVDFIRGDMRTLAIDSEFDMVVCWFTSFGYFDDQTLKASLHRMRDALVPGGRLLIETMNLHEHGLSDEDTPTTKELIGEDGKTQFMIDATRYDPHDGRLYVRRFITRSGEETRSMEYFIRLFTLTEIKAWLLEAGLTDVQAYGGGGEIFRVDSNRLIVTAQKP